MGYGLITGCGFKNKIVMKSKNGKTVNPDIFDNENQTFTGRKTFNGGIDTTELNARDINVTNKLMIGEKNIVELVKAIPSDATEENKLTTESFVNSSIATNTAFFRGTFESVEELEEYEGEKTNNDYAFVRTTDEYGAISFNRYKYNSQSESWEYEYTLNNSSFTSAQWEAINSGITEELVAQIGQGGSALVPSITQAQYNDLTEEEKNNGQIREIKDTEPKKVMLNGMDLNGNIINENAPIGTLMQYAKDCPNGYVKCNGTSLSRTNYNRLFEKIGTTYGADDENTFKVPLITDKALLNVEYMTGKRHADGRPTYIKIYSDPNNSWNARDNIIGNIENFKEPITIKAIAFNDTGLGGWVENNEGGDARCYSYIKSNGEVHFYRNDIRDGIAYPKKVIIEYTKTTDTENTFCYNQLAGSNFCIKATDYSQATEDVIDDSKITTGNVLSAAKVVEMNSYSTEEIIVGKWIDEKNIYRKVFTFDTPIQAQGKWGIVKDLENEDTLIGGTWLNITPVSGHTMTGSANVGKIPNNKIGIYIPVFSEANYIKAVILEYTKTTD